MQPTVRKMRQGSKLLLGRYSVGNDANPEPIEWVKATVRGDFITSRVIDVLCFDAKEQSRPMHGNSDYSLSNIHRYLNSAENDWYMPQHDLDNSPRRPFVDVSGWPQGSTYADHYGFLRYFDDYEIDCIQTQTFCVGSSDVTGKIRLPMIADISGDNKFGVFGKIGIRAHPSFDLLRIKGTPGGFVDRENCFVPYYFADAEERTNHVHTLSRNGKFQLVFAESGCGIRPTCRINLDTNVEEIDENVFIVLPFGEMTTTVSNEDIIAFLGLV